MNVAGIFISIRLATSMNKIRNKNPLSASGYAPVASESVVALSVRVALRAVSRYQSSCSRAGSALRAEWDIGKSECREIRVDCFQDQTAATSIVDAS